MQLNIPRLFAALVVIAVTGVALFAVTVAISRAAPPAGARAETTSASVSANAIRYLPNGTVQAAAS